MKNFLKGYSSVLDLFPEKKSHRTHLEKLNLPKDAAEAIRRDWEAVGKDIRKSMSIIEKEIQKNGKREQ